MPFGDNGRSQSAFPSAVEPDIGKITPNRQAIDDKFPVLGFTVQTGGLPYFEVLLTTDRSLFAPANAGRRNTGNFYASRQDSGLIRATGPEAIYLVPPAVLRAFAQAVPRPSAIYYTLITYRSEDGGSPVFAQMPESLPTHAPSVSMAAGFTGQTLSRVLGIPLEQLKPVYAPSALPTADGYSAPYGGTDYSSVHAFSNDIHRDQDEDRAEGEDGYDVAQSTDEKDWLENGMEAHGTAWPYGDDESDLTANGTPFSDSYAADQISYHEHKVDGYAADTLGYGGEVDYRDGYEDEYGPLQNGLAGAQESVFPVGAVEPQPLNDEESPYGEELAGDEMSDDEDPDSASFATYESDGAYADEATFANDEDEERYAEDGSEAGAMEAEALDGNGYLDEDDATEEGGHPLHNSSYEADSYGDEMELSFEALDAAPAAATTRQPLTIEIKKRIIERITRFDSSRDRYSMINPDGEYAGHCGTSHPAYHRYHIGLSYGLIPFTQGSGLLGRLLVMMRQRDGQAFSQTFGGDPRTLQQLIDVTTAPGPASRKSPGGRSARVQPVGGADLWVEPWVSRFRLAGQHVPFKAAQNQLAAESFLDPMLQFAGWLGLDSERALAMVTDRAIQMGRGGAVRWIVSVAGPIQTDALRGQALAALGHSDLRQFQRATPGLGSDSDPMTHAALVAALRALGAHSPIPIPTREQMMDAMVRGAAGHRWAHRIKELRQTGDLGDTPLQF